MLREYALDMQNNSVYISNRLNKAGIIAYPHLLKKTIESYDDTYLATIILADGLLNAYEKRNSTNVKVPYNANATLAEGEFNRFYLRGLCLYATENGIENVVIYRARESSQPRPESEAKIGKFIKATDLLRDLRKNIATDVALGIPSGVNSGLSAKLS